LALQTSRSFGFAVEVAEKALVKAVNYRVRQSQRIQRRRTREARAEAVAKRRKERMISAEVRKKFRSMRAGKHLTMQEILRRP
jgi:hypothetical protein